jgi:predicted dehydrogenase
MKFLIAGLGSIGRRHLRNLVSLGESDILLYRTGHSTLPDQDLAGFPVETNLDRALAEISTADDLRAVIVANPTALHLDVAIQAAEAGCHLLLEKPVSNSLERTGELENAVARQGVQVLVGYQFRFHPGLQAMARLLAQGAIGQPVSARAHWGEYLPGWHPWEDYRLGYSARAHLGGGAILTLSHPLDYLRWLLGEVEAVWAVTGRTGELDLDVEDTAEIGLKLSGGLDRRGELNRHRTIASVHLDYNQQPPSHHLEVIGAQGSLRWDNQDGALHVYGKSSQWKWETLPPPENFERNDLFLSEMRHFLEVVQGNAQPVCTLQDGIKALQVALAAFESAREERMIYLS